MIAEMKILGMTLSEEVGLCISCLDLLSKGSQDDMPMPRCLVLAQGIRFPLLISQQLLPPLLVLLPCSLFSRHVFCQERCRVCRASLRSSPVRIISSRAGA